MMIVAASFVFPLFLAKLLCRLDPKTQLKPQAKTILPETDRSDSQSPSKPWRFEEDPAAS